MSVEWNNTPNGGKRCHNDRYVGEIYPLKNGKWGAEITYLHNGDEITCGELTTAEVATEKIEGWFAEFGDQKI